jgi:hypothetical protein
MPVVVTVQVRILSLPVVFRGRVAGLTTVFILES